MFLFKNPHQINVFCSVSSADARSCASASIQIEEINRTQLPCPDLKLFSLPFIITYLYYYGKHEKFLLKSLC